MDFSEVIGQKHLKSHLHKTVENGRIPHAQLFVGTAGSPWQLLMLKKFYAGTMLKNPYRFYLAPVR
jgi:DNA polymerase-3 subunit delta'